MIELNRLFLAFTPDATERAACAAAAKRVSLMQQGGRMTTPENLHITLAFLGNAITAEREATLMRELRVPATPELRLTLDVASSFKTGKDVAWWLGTKQTPPELADFVKAVVAQLAPLGIEPDGKRFVPHMTIVRGAGRPLAQTPITPIALKLDTFALYRSEWERGGGYRELMRWYIKGAAGLAGSSDQLSLKF